MFEIIDYKEGMKIEKNCIIRGMPNDIYHKKPALSNSGLKTLLDCPAKYYYKYLSGEYEPKEKPHFKIGKAVHCYLLEGREQFEKIYWTNPYYGLKKEEKIEKLKSFGYDNIPKTTTVAQIDDFLLCAAGIGVKEIELTPSELNQVVCMVKAAKADKKTANALSQLGESELSIFAYDDELDVWLKCRPDFLPYNPVNVPDYKTSDSANPAVFYNKFLDYGYHIQAAMYRRVVKLALDFDIENFYFLVQEKEPPYITQIFNPVETLIDWGEKAVKNGVEKYKECKEKDLWGGYSDKIIELSMEFQPDYLTTNYDKTNGIIYAPNYIDKILEKYEV